MLDAQDIDHEGQEGSPGQADQYGEEEEGELEHYEDQPSPEQYNGGISNALADQRVSRKRAQEDVKLLANRIALLKLEEKKAWKKIEETKKKAGDIMQVRVRNQETSKNKQQLRAQREQEEHERLERNREERLRQSEMIKHNMMTKAEKNFHEAERLKQERAQHEEMIQIQKQADEMKAKQMKEMIRA